MLRFRNNDLPEDEDLDIEWGNAPECDDDWGDYSEDLTETAEDESIEDELVHDDDIEGDEDELVEEYEYYEVNDDCPQDSEEENK